MSDCHEFLQYILLRLGYRWAGFRKVRRQVCKRIHQRMYDLGLKSYRDYITYIDQHPEESKTIDLLLDITISRFWRDRGVFDLIEKIVLPDRIGKALHQNRSTVKCLSIGCCNGEEVYSVSLIWNVRLKPEAIDLEILAVDRNETVLERAKIGRYPKGALKDVPADILKKGFIQENNEYIIKEKFKMQIRFSLQDIRNQIPDGPFDLILCRNLVFTYFDEKLQNHILDELLLHLLPGGYFIIGSNEHLPKNDDRLFPIKRGEAVYQSL